MFRRSATGAFPSGSGSVVLATGWDSPVKAASSACSRTLTMTRPSAGTRAPAARATTSPGTRSASGDLMLLAIADDMRHRRGLLPEGGEGLRRLPLGQEADERVQDDHGEDGGRLDALAQGEGHRGRRQQQDHDEALELIDENRQKRPRRFLGERVGAVPLEAAGRLDAAQAALGLGVDAPAHLVSGQRVPRFGVLGNGRPHAARSLHEEHRHR